MKKQRNKTSILMLALTLICALFMFNMVIADDTCPYHLEHTEECGYVEAVEGSECTHECDESCLSRELICNKEVHEHTEECYDEIGELICNLEEHSHVVECYEQKNNCQHQHNEECGYKEAVEGHECTHLCSHCDKELLISGKVEIKDDSTLHVESKLIGTQSEDQVYFYVKMNKSLLEFITLEKDNNKYIVDLENEKKLALEPIYMSDDNDNVYLKYEQEYGSTLLFDIPLSIENESISEVIYLTSASNFDESDQKELDDVLLGYYPVMSANVMTLSDEDVNNTVNTANETTSQVTTKTTTPTGIDFGEYITGVNLEKYENGHFVDVTDGNVNDGDIISLTLDFALPAGTVTLDSKIIYYQLPDNVKPLEAMSGIVYENGKAEGTYTISEDGLITITFYDEYANGEAIYGTINFNGSASLDEDGTETKKVVIGETEFTINPVVEQKKYDIDTNKNAIKDADTNVINYTVEVSSVNGTETSITLTDVLTGGATYDKESFAIVASDGTVISLLNLLSFTDDNTGFTINDLPQLDANEKYTLTYKVNIDSSKANSNGEQNIGNTVKVTSGNNLDQSGTYTEVSGQRIFKTGNSTRGDGKITWTIQAVDVKAGYVITDILPDGLKWDGSATISPAINNNQNITFTKNETTGEYSYEIPEGITEASDYTITFETVVTDPGDFNSSTMFRNLAELTTPDGEKEYTNDSTVTYYNEHAISKQFSGKNDETVNGAYYNWNVSLTLPDLSEVESYTYIDTMSATQGNGEHYIDETFAESLVIKDASGNVIPKDCYTIKYYNGDTEITELGTATTFKIQFDVDKLKNLDTSKLTLNYNTYAKYSMDPGQGEWYKNTGNIEIDPEGDEKPKTYPSESGQWYAKEGALTKTYVTYNLTNDGADYTWKTTLNVPSTANLTNYVYEDILSSDSSLVNHYITDEDSFIENLVLTDQDGNPINISSADSEGNTINLYDVEFVKDNSGKIVGFKLKFNPTVLNSLEPVPSQINITYKTHAVYDMLPGEKVTYSNTGKITIDDKTYEDKEDHPYTKDSGLRKDYTTISNQTNDGAVYHWTSTLTCPDFKNTEVYTYTDKLSTSVSSNDHYIMYNNLNLVIKDENNIELFLGTHYTIQYLDSDGKQISSPSEDDKVFGYIIAFNCDEIAELENVPKKLYLTYQTSAEYNMLPGETVKYVNDAIVTIDDKTYEDDADAAYKKDDAVTKKFGTEVDATRNEAYYTWNSTLTFPNNNILENYEYVDILTSDSDTVNHYIIKDKLNLSIKDQNNQVLGDTYYDVVFLDVNGEEISEDDTTTMITGFKIVFDCITTDSDGSIQDLDITKLNISYQTYAKYDMNAGDTVNYINNATVNINSNPYESEATRPHTKDKLLKKLNGIFDGNLKDPDNWYRAYKEKRKLFFPTYSEDDVSLELTKIDGRLYYLLLITPDDTDEDIVITDHLPEYTTLISGLDDNKSDDDYAPFVYYYKDQWNYGDPGLWTEDYNNTLDSCFSYTYDTTSNSVTFTLDKRAKELFKTYNQYTSKYIAIAYAVDIQDTNSSLDITKVYNNTVEWNGETDESTQKVHFEADYLDKVGMQIENSNKVQYSLVVNPGGANLLEDSDRITLIDQMTDINSFDYVSFVQDSLKVYAYDTSAAGNKGEELNSALYKFTYDTSTYTLTVELPDNVACVVEYEYLLDANTIGGTTFNITNKARIEGVEESSTEDKTEYKVPSSSAEVTKKRFTIYKVDSKNYAVTLTGAEFNLYYYVSQENNWVQVNDTVITTDSEGKLVFTSSDSNGSNTIIHLDENKLYKLEEKKAPTGYSFDNYGAFTYFVIKPENIDVYGDNGVISSSILDKLTLKKDQVKVLNANGDTIYVPNDYTSLTVQKLWVNEDGTVNSNHPESIQLYLKKETYKDQIVIDEKYTVTVNIYTKEGKLVQKYSETFNDVLKGSSFRIENDCDIFKDSQITDNDTEVSVKSYSLPDQEWEVNYYYEIESVNENHTINFVSNWYGGNNTIDYVKASQHVEKSLVSKENYQDFELNSEDGWAKTWDELALSGNIDGETYYYYYSVEEIDVPSGWTVHYDGNNVQSGNIIVTNTKDKEAIVLPDVGGYGNIPYIISGLAMICLGLILVIFRKSTKRKVGES